jgi:hypothetical protein
MDPVALITSILAPFFIVGILFLAFIFFLRGAAKGLSKDGRGGGMASISFWNILKSIAISIHQVLNPGKSDDSLVTKPGADPAISQDKPLIVQDKLPTVQDKPDSEHQ